MTNAARQAILGSIRSHLAASAPYDKLELAATTEPSAVAPGQSKISSSLVESFKQNLESIGANCVIANGDTEIARALTEIINNCRGQHIAISDHPEVKRLLYLTDLEIEELAIAPNKSDIFRFDVGISTAQAAIAETGTLILDSTQERHRFVSLVPPFHIAIVDASKIYATLGEALGYLREGKEISPVVTFITGPSRTADIELTLTIGVHGPQQLSVIVRH